MTNDNRAKLRFAALMYSIVNAVVFGIGMIVIMSVPAVPQGAPRKKSASALMRFGNSTVDRLEGMTNSGYMRRPN